MKQRLMKKDAALDLGLKTLSVGLWLHKGNMASALLYLATWSEDSSRRLCKTNDYSEHRVEVVLATVLMGSCRLPCGSGSICLQLPAKGSAK